MYQDKRVDLEWDREQIDLISRWYRLRKEGKGYPIIYTNGMLYKIVDVIDAWGTKEYLAWDVLERDVEELEGVMRKPVQSEKGKKKEIRYGTI